MAKLAVLLATFSLFCFLANASIHTTITVDNDDNPWGRQEDSCHQQIRKQNYLEHCQKFMEEQCSGGSCDNPRRSQHLDSCCEQLEKLDRQCQCTGLKQAIQKQMEGQTGREEVREIQQMIEKIMSKCNMEPRKCDMPNPRTSITLDSEENPRGTQECREQIKKQNNLKHCQKYMEEQRESRSCDNPRRRQQHLDSCCEQLEQLDRQCRCPGLKQAMQQQMGQGREEMQEMHQIVQKIMNKCDVEPRRCDTPFRGWF